MSTTSVCTHWGRSGLSQAPLTKSLEQSGAPISLASYIKESVNNGVLLKLKGLEPDSHLAERVLHFMVARGVATTSGCCSF